MFKLDAHQHFWDLAKFPYPWLGPELTPLYRNFGPADLEPLLTECGVSGTIAVQASHSQAETEWLLELAGQTAIVKGVVGWVDLGRYDLSGVLEELAGKGNLAGIRHQVHDEADPRWLLQGKIIRGLRLVARQGLAYDLLVRPEHLPRLPELFGEVEDMRWVVDHLAKPLIKSGQRQPWQADLKTVAQYPSVYCKVSGLITEAAQQSWTRQDIQPYFEAALEMFGPKRLLWGSDWPVCLLAGSYRQVHDLLAALISDLSETEQAAIWGQTAREVYGLAE